MFFSRSMLASIFNRFSEARNVKNSNFASTGAQFSQNRRFRKSSEQNLDFGFVFVGQNGENSKKMELKNMWFFNFDLFSFFFDFSRFWLDFGRPRALQKSKKIRKN